MQNKSYLGRIILKILSFENLFDGRKLLYETYERYDVKDGSVDLKHFCPLTTHW